MDVHKKQKWYFTFMQKQTYLKDRFVVFEGSYNEAREQMFYFFGSEWGFQYSESDFENITEKYDLKEFVLK